MIKTTIINRVPNQLRLYAAAANKSIGDAVKEEARFLAQRLVKLTPPKNGKEGRNAVERDVNKVYLAADWFLQKFSFKNQTFGDRIKELIRAKNVGELEQSFERSPKLKRLHIEPFKSSIIAKFRNKGRVSDRVVPSSFPVADEKGKKAYTKKKGGNVGLMKSGWANCLQALGGAVASWLRKAGTGYILDKSKDANPTVTLVNTVDYAADFDRRNNISKRATQGRAKDLARKAQMLLDRIRQGKP